MPGCSPLPSNSQQDNIKGYIHLNNTLDETNKTGEREKLSLSVSLLDVSKMDVAAETLSKKVFHNIDTWPTQYNLTFNPSQLQAGRSYAIQARVLKGDQLLAINDERHAFSLQSDRDNFDVLLKVLNTESVKDTRITLECPDNTFTVRVSSNYLMLTDSIRGRKIFQQERAASGAKYRRYEGSHEGGQEESIWLHGNDPALWQKNGVPTKCQVRH